MKSNSNNIEVNNTNDVKALFALGCKGGLRIAKALSVKEWRSASEIAEELNLHIATAVTHLSNLESAGVAVRRLRSGKRRAFEYRLHKSEILIYIDLSGKKASSDAESPISLAGFAYRLSGVLGADFDSLVRLMDADTAQALKAVMDGDQASAKDIGTLLTALIAGSVARMGRRATIGLMTAAGYDLNFTMRSMEAIDCE